MVSLTDIGTLERHVIVQGESVPVFPISARSLVVLLDRFPILRGILAERKVSITIEDFLKLAPEVVGSIIACGIGKPGDKDEEQAAANLGIGDQGDLLIGIFDATFPRGFGPFVEFMERAQAGASVGTGRAPVTKSPSPSNGASRTATDKAPGTTAHDSSLASESSLSEEGSPRRPT